MLKNKKNGAFIAIIAVLLLVICGLVVFILNNNNNKNESNKQVETINSDVADNTEEFIEDNENSEESNTTDLKEELEEDNNLTKSDIIVDVVNSNSWNNNDKYFAQLDLSVHNKTNEEIKNWSIKLFSNNEVVIDNNWSCEAEYNKDCLIITPADYNDSIASNSSISDIGIIVNCKSQSDIDSLIDNTAFFIDDKEYKINSGNSLSNNDSQKDDSSNDDGSNENDIDKNEDSSKVDNNITNDGKTPYDNHGKLSLNGVNIVDKNGDKLQLKGVSTHGLAWFPEYVNKDAFNTFRDDWGANVVRLALYTAENGGYCTDGNKDNLKKTLYDGIDSANELGLYVIVDWHILHDLSPMVYVEESKVFFDEVSKKYKDNDNIIYEICNEPNGGTSWDEIKEYAEIIIPIIRENDKDAIIIVGTPNWSQDVDIVSNNPIKGYDNIMYAVHFYAATHKDPIRNKVEVALENELPIFVSEFSICDASGNGGIDYDEADAWMNLINDNNISYVGWSVCNKQETASLINSSCSKTSGWVDDDLSETGKWLKDKIGNN